jgi:hypothetical protein
VSKAITPPLKVGGCDPILFGRRGFVPGGSFSAMSPDAKRASPFPLYFSATVRKLGVFIDGNGPGGGFFGHWQNLRGVIYAHGPDGGPGALIGRTFQFTMPHWRPGHWVELYMAPPVRLSPGVYWLGIHSGGPTTRGLARFAWDARENSRRFNIDGYGDGPNDPFGGAPSDNQLMSIYASGAY